jgi:VanZ family protein
MSDDWRHLIEKRLQSLELRSAVDEVHRTNVETRLRGIEDTLKWLVRLLVGGLLTGGVVYVLNGGLVL